MPQIVLICGRKNSGKTTYLQNIVNRVKTRGRQVSGVLTVSEFLESGQKIYFIKDLQSGQQQFLASPKSEFSRMLHFGNYFFNPEALEFANRILCKNITADYVFLDEYGPLEVRGEGMKPAFHFLMKNFEGVLFITVRPSLLPVLKSEIKARGDVSLARRI